LSYVWYIEREMGKQRKEFKEEAENAKLGPLRHRLKGRSPGNGNGNGRRRSVGGTALRRRGVELC